MIKPISKYLFVVSALVLGSCASLEQASMSADDQTTRPVKQAAPGGPAQAAVQRRARISGRNVPSQVDKNPPAIYRRIEPSAPVSFPDFERPRASANSLRGKGMPRSEITTIFQGEEYAPNSWTGSSGGYDDIGWDDNGSETGFLFIPPDPHAAAGPDHLVSVVNVMIRMRDKYTGEMLYQDSLKDFFTEGLGAEGPDTFTFDPKVLYDQYEDRWVVITLEQDESPNVSKIFLAVSDDEDPTGLWYMTVIDSSITIDTVDYWADYPGFAVDDKAIYVTCNLFTFGTYVNGGVRLWIIDKGIGAGGLYDDGITAVSVYDPYALGGLDVTTQPTHMYGDVPAGLGTFLVGYSGLNYGNGLEALQVVTVEDPLVTPTFTVQYADTGDIDDTNRALSDAGQSGTSTDIEVNDRRALDAVWRDDSLWLTATVYPASGDNRRETTAYWAQIDTSVLSTLVLADQGEVGGEDIARGMFTFFPSIAVDASGNMVTGFSASNDSTYAGAYFVTRSPVDAAGTTGDSQVVKEGVDYYVRDFGGTRNRWGDYSGTVVDTANGCFWVFNEWADSRDTGVTEGGRWGTAFEKTCTCASTLQPVIFDDWHSFSLPCNPAPDSQVQDIFPQLGAANYNVTWVVARWDAVTNAYDYLSATEPMEAGVGYWLLALTPDPLPAHPIVAQTDGSPHQGEDIPLVGVTTTGRYNLLGHQQNGTAEWADFLVVDGGLTYTLDQVDPLDTEADPDILECSKVTPGETCWMSRIMYKWNGASYDPYDGVTLSLEGTLEPFETFWVQAFRPDISLRWPGTGAAVAAESSVSRLESAATRTTSVKARKPVKKSDDWFIRLIASSPDKQDRGNVLGQLADSLDGLDRHDLATLAPHSYSYLDLLFTNPLLGETDWGFASDYRALTKKPQGEWPFVVRASADISKVTLSWEGERTLFSKAWLLDEQSGAVYRIKQGDSHTFSMTAGGENHFVIWLE